MNILITSGHYYLSDKSGSEPLWGIEIAKQYRAGGHEVYMIAGVADLKSKINGVRLYSLRSKRSTNIIVESLMRAIYPLFSFTISIYICIRLGGKISLIHHIAPVSVMSYDLFFIFRPIPNATYIIGPSLVTPRFDDKTAFSQGSGVNHSKISEIIHALVKYCLPLLKKLFLLTLKQASFLIVATPESKTFYSHFLSSKKIVQIPIGISLPDQRKLKKEKKGNKVTIVSVSNLIERKGVDLILLAFANLRRNYNNVYLHIVGDGYEMTNLKQQVSNLQIDKYVKFIGFVEHTQLGKYYSSADIFCSATRYEPYGMTLIEAMYYRLPVVCSDVNSTKFIIDKGGLTFKKDNISELIKSLNLLIHNKRLRLKLGSFGHNRVVKDFTWETIVEKYLGLVNNQK